MSEYPRPPLPWYVVALPAVLLFFFIGPLLPHVLFGDRILPLLIGSMLMTQVLSVLVILQFLRHEQPPGQRLQELSLGAFGRAELRATLGYCAAAILIVWPLNIVTQLILHLLGHEPKGNPILEWMATQPWGFVVVAAFVAVCVAPITEEIIFRVVLYRCVERRFGMSLAIPLVSFLFGAVHMIPEQIPGLFVLALLLQVALLRTRHLLVPVLVHAFFNGVTVTLLILARLYFPEALT